MDAYVRAARLELLVTNAVSRRVAMLGLGSTTAAVSLAVGACNARERAKPGWRSIAVGLTSTFHQADIPAGISRIRTSGYSRPGVGGAEYVLDDDQENPAESPARKRSANGLWFVLAETAIDIRMTGASGAGRDTDAPRNRLAILAALDTVARMGGGRVVIPAGVYKIDGLIPIASDGVSIEGVGTASRIQQLGADGAATIFYADGRRGITIRDVHVQPGTKSASLLTGWGIRFRNCTDCWAINIEGSRHRRGVVIIESCVRSGWRGGYAHDSVVSAAAGDNHGDAGYDFLIANSSSDCHGEGGRSDGGCGIGFAIQTFPGKGGHEVKNCSMRAFSVRNAPMYGAMVYRGNAADRFENIVIDFKSIDTVRGDLPDGKGNRIFGAGFYGQGVDGLQVSFGVVRNTNLWTDRAQLAPAGVGFANCRRFKVRGELIENCAWYGFMATDTNQVGDPRGGLADVNVNVRGSGKANLYFQDIPNARIRGSATGGSSYGVWIRNVATKSSGRYDLLNFKVSGTGDIGINAEAGSLFVTDGEIVGSAGAYALNYAGGGTLYFKGMRVDARRNRGGALRVLAGSKSVEAGDGNVFTTAALGKFGVLNAPVRGLGRIEMRDEDGKPYAGPSPWLGTAAAPR